MEDERVYLTADEAIRMLPDGEILASGDAAHALHRFAAGNVERELLQAEVERLRPFAESADRMAADVERLRAEISEQADAIVRLARERDSHPDMPGGDREKYERVRAAWESFKAERGIA